MKMIAVIPARYESTRLPGKPLKTIQNKPMIQWVYEAVLASDYFDKVIVATDDQRIIDCVMSFNGLAVMTRSDHISGTDRVAEVAELYSYVDVIANIQGDQPFITKKLLCALLKPYLDKTNPEMTTVACQLKNDDFNNPNVVKVLLNKNGEALYFSRASIPYYREKGNAPVYCHLGLYAFQRDFLLKYSKMSVTDLERCEGLEQLRALENGYKILVTTTKDSIFEINTYNDLARAKKLYETD